MVVHEMPRSRKSHRVHDYVYARGPFDETLERLWTIRYRALLARCESPLLALSGSGWTCREWSRRTSLNSLWRT